MTRVLEYKLIGTELKCPTTRVVSIKAHTGCLLVLRHLAFCV